MTSTSRKTGVRGVIVKPLDLNVSIQNTYEAARVEAVRLEKEHVVNQLANEDSLREQRLRDQQVNSPAGQILHEDLFSAEAYEAPDYAEFAEDKPGKKKGEKEAAPQEKATEETEGQKNEEAGDKHGGFSTYA